MSKQIQVNLAFNADTSKAKQQINDLVNSLNKIATKDSQIFDDRQLREAATAAKDLTKHLEAAVNVNTGKLDLNKFSQSLSHSKQNLQDLYNSLSKAGPQGQQAFLQLASSIASSDSQVLNLNSKVKDLGQTLKNTIKWQLSSSLVHGFMGALQHAIGYAKDLNSSLNDIRIVTGASAEQMAKFAEQANKSAKALSSTTTEYTKASLIYYQQGLSDEEVKARTDITIKMANVSKESAQVVSDQMTAVWNNFYDGSKSLEYYADVMTALGAATASSVDEIAGGLEKFAAIGDTIGLSYEYAASALATITSNTRQSEEVVGTALKTIFARIQGLNLGETLDDGTTLNKYSQALEKVGINIFDQAGELKAMDNILDELGDKWQTLSKDQQTALAQTVAGTRQYTQLVALMDNWNKGDSDSFKSNLQTIAGSEGALQEQQDIYAESWEAAADRVKAATEDIYDSLINDEFIVKILNTVEKVTNLVGTLIDGFGGLQGIVLMLGATFAKSFAKEAPEALNKLKTNLKIITGKAEEEKRATVKNAQSIIDKDIFTGGNKTRAEATKQELASLIQLEEQRERLTESEYKYLKGKIAEKKASQELVAVKEDERAQIEKEIQLNEKRNAKTAAKSSKAKMSSKDKKSKLLEDKDILQARQESLEQGRDKLLAKKRKGDTLSIKQAEDLDSYNQELEAIQKRNEELKKSIQLEEHRAKLIKENNLEIEDEDGNVKIDEKGYENLILEKSKQLKEEYQKKETSKLLYEDYNKQVGSWQGSISSLSLKNLNTEEQQKEINKIKKSIGEYAEKLNKANSTEFETEKFNELKSKIDDTNVSAEQMLQTFIEFASIDKINNATNEIEKTSKKVTELKEDIEALTPENFEKIDNAAQEGAESVALMNHEVERLQHNSEEIDVKIEVDSSQIAETLVELSSVAMDIGAIFTQLSTIMSTALDKDLSFTDKLKVSLSSLGGIGLSVIQIFSTISQPGFLKGLTEMGGALASAATSGSLLSGVLGKIGGGLSAAGASAGAAAIAFGKVVLVIMAVKFALDILSKVLEWFHSMSPEGQLEAAQKATEGMAQAANDANTAYQNLLNTISGYDSAVSALEGLEVGTQEFTNALINANEKAWELIDAYNLIQGQDWEYGKNGEIIIKVSAKERITQEENNRRESMMAGESAAEIVTKEAQYNVDKNNLSQVYSDETLNNIYKTFFESGKAGEIKAALEEVDALKDEGKLHSAQQAEKKLINSLGEQIYENWDYENEHQRTTISDALRHDFKNLETAFNTKQDLDGTRNLQMQKMLSTVLSDEESYQKSSLQGLITEMLLDDNGNYYKNAKSVADSRWDNQGEDAKSNADIQTAWTDYLKQVYIEENGKYYRKDASGNKTGEAVENLTTDVDQQRKILAYNDMLNQLEQQGIELSKQTNQLESTMSDEELKYATALARKDASSLTESEIDTLRSKAGERNLKLTDLFDSGTLSSMEDDTKLAFEMMLESFTKSVKDWTPPEFDLSSWTSQFNTIKDLNIGDTIDADAWAALDESMQQYFTKTLDGEYMLIAAADELTNKLKQDLSNEIIQQKQQKIDMESAAGFFGVEKMPDKASSYANPNGSYGVSLLAYNQLDFIKASGAEESAKSLSEALDKALENKDQGEIEAVLKQIAEAAGQAKVKYDELDGSIKQNGETIMATSTNLQSLQDNWKIIDNNEAYSDGLKRIAAQYEECEEGLSEYQDVLQNSQGAMEEYFETLKKDKSFKNMSDNAKKYGKALSKLTKEIKKAEWNKFTEGALDAAKALKSATNSEDVQKNLKKIQKAFKDSMGFEVPMESLEKYKDKFIEWAESSEEASDDVATEIYSLLQLEKQAENPISLTLDDGQVISSLSSTENLFNQVKSYIEGTGITVSATGQADLSGLIAELMGAGGTAVEVARALMSIGQTQVSFDAFGSGLVEYDLGTVSGLIAFINDLTSFRGGIETSGILPNTDEWNNAFKSGGFSGGGGGRHPSSGNGGGGGGSKKHAEKKSDSERTRYHTLENQLEDLSAEYDEISEAADRAFGKEKLDNIDAQIKKTDELIDKQEEYLDAISQNLPIDKNVMTAYYDDVIGGPAMQFDENGNISNYDAIEEAMFNKYNSMADRYTDDSEEWQVFEKKYEQLEKYIEQYEETYDLLRDEEAAYQELLNQRADLELEKVQYKIELELDVPESEINKLEYQIGRIEDDAYESAEAVQLLTKQAEAVYDQIQVNKQGLNDVIKLSQSFNNGALTEEQADLIKEYRDNLLDLNEEFDDIRATIEEKVMETFDSFNEKLQTSVDVFDHYNSVLESYKNIVDIVGEDRLGISDQFMNGLNQASIDNAIEQLKATDTAMKVIQDAQAQAEVALAEAKARGDEASQRMWEETLSSLNEEAQSAQEEMLSAWENALDAIAETFEATVERVIKTFNESVYALGGLEGLQDDFSRQQENADIMLDDYQKIYELSKLSRDINKTIDDTDVIGGKQKLKKLLGEINKLQEDGVEMSQYDLEYLQKTYDLRLAELELEEAQRAKNTVRLSRDNEGNWSYVYTQNTDAVDAAQQKYEDALYAMQDLSSNYIDEMSEQLISTSQEMAEALAAIRIQDYANIEDYYAEVERVQSQYQEELAMQEEELQKAIDNNKVLYDTDWTNYHNTTGYKISDTELFATTFRDTLLGVLMGSEEDSANFTDIMGTAVSDLTNNLMAGAEIYYTNLENAMNAAGTSTGDFAEDTAANIDAVVEKSKEGAAAVDQMAIEMQTAMENIMDSVTNWQEAYGMAMENIIQSNLEVIESFNQMLAALSIDADSITVKYDIADAAGNKAQQFDTGGYTGEWGKGGKLAVLHEKELILNPGDTSNFLTAVQITRAMLETIDLNAKQASFGLGNLVPSTIKDDNTQTLEQQVHIIAEFPNVNDHNEIEQAFSNLINTASQYANRK